jgi:hypothetical protein
MPHAEIKTHQAKQTLDHLHAELAGKIIDNEKEAGRLIEAMRHVEAVLKLMDPGYSLRTALTSDRRPDGWIRSRSGRSAPLLS